LQFIGGDHGHRAAGPPPHHDNFAVIDRAIHQRLQMFPCLAVGSFDGHGDFLMQLRTDVRRISVSRRKAAWRAKRADGWVSIADLLLVSHGQNSDGLAIEAITRHIAAIAKVDYLFAILIWDVLNGSANLRLKPQHLQGFDDRVGSSLGGNRILWPQESPQPLQIPDGTGGIDHLWHAGVGNSFSVPQLASHVSTSAAVACKPVS
jgi:hypothetical protein